MSIFILRTWTDDEGPMYYTPACTKDVRDIILGRLSVAPAGPRRAATAAAVDRRLDEWAQLGWSGAFDGSGDLPDTCPHHVLQFDLYDVAGVYVEVDGSAVW